MNLLKGNGALGGTLLAVAGIAGNIVLILTGHAASSDLWVLAGLGGGHAAGVSTPTGAKINPQLLNPLMGLLDTVMNTLAPKRAPDPAPPITTTTDLPKNVTVVPPSPVTVTQRLRNAGIPEDQIPAMIGTLPAPTP